MRVYLDHQQQGETTKTKRFTPIPCKPGPPQNNKNIASND
jgi:hypothetical protein